MKTKNKLYLLAVTTAAGLALNATTGIGQVFSYQDVISNQAVAASLRMKELYPELKVDAKKPTEVGPLK